MNQKSPPSYCIQAEKFETKFLLGEEYQMPYDSKLWETGPTKRDMWAQDWLKKNGLPIKSQILLRRANWRGDYPTTLIVSTYNYK